MKLLKTIGMLILSILLWIILLTPRVIIIFISIVESILKVIKSTLTHLIKQVKAEVLK